MVAGLLLTGCSAQSGGAGPDAADATYGALPSWLADTSGQADSVLTGTVDRPALTAEGDAVHVVIGGASVLVDVAGPVVPGEGLPYQGPTTTCTWTVTLTGATAMVPIVIGDFSASDHLGTVYRPTLVPGRPVPPSSVGPGQNVTFELRAVMQTGEGLMRWAPGGKQLVASWDFEVEND